MFYLHFHGILHRNLKPNNVLLDNFVFPKFSNFCLSKSEFTNQFDNNKSVAVSFKVTQMFMVPEIWSNSLYSKSSDYYEFEIVVYEIMTC